MNICGGADIARAWRRECDSTRCEALVNGFQRRNGDVFLLDGGRGVRHFPDASNGDSGGRFELLLRRGHCPLMEGGMRQREVRGGGQRFSAGG